MREGCSVALMGLLLDTIPDWGLSPRVAFTIFALCMTNLAEAAERLQVHLAEQAKAPRVKLLRDRGRSA